MRLYVCACVRVCYGVIHFVSSRDSFMTFLSVMMEAAECELHPPAGVRGGGDETGGSAVIFKQEKALLSTEEGHAAIREIFYLQQEISHVSYVTFNRPFATVASI